MTDEKSYLKAEHEGSLPQPTTSKFHCSTYRHTHQQNIFVKLPALLKCIILVILIIFLTVFPIPKIKSFSPCKHAKTVENNLCTTPECIHAASEILYNLSPSYKSLDPCSDDLEELVCGGWRDRHDLRPDQGDLFTGTIMVEASQQLLRHIVEAPYPKDSKHSYFSPMNLATVEKSLDEQNFDKLKDAYSACINTDSIAKLGLMPLQRLVDSVRILYPAQEIDIRAETLPKLLSWLAQSGVFPLAGAYTGADDRDPDTVIVQITAPGRIGLPARERYFDDGIVAKYTTVLEKVLPAFTIVDSNSVQDLIAFEKKLAGISPKSEDRGDITKTYNPFSLKDASEMSPEIGLSDMVESLKRSNISVDRVIVTSPDYLKNLSSILAETSAKTKQDYFVWKIVQSFYSFVEDSAIEPYKRFSKELSGQDPDSHPDRWRTCLNHVDDGLGWILSRFFVEKAFSASAKKFGDQIVYDIKDLFIEKLKVTEWMDESVIELAIDKVHNIVQKIGYPTESPNIMSPPSLKSFYESVPIKSDEYFANALAMVRFDIRNNWDDLGKPVDRNAWGMTIPTVNAYYNPPGNEIVFPAGIMQFPVFSVDVPKYLSYGAFGSVAGHELSHAFDSTGRHYDSKGNYTDWWTEDTIKKFTQRAECFVDQYRNYTIDAGPGKAPLHVNGKLTLGENIADAGGLAAGFKAWKRSLDRDGADKDLPGLSKDFTHEQLFFISYGTWWCSKTTTEAAINRIFNDPHSPKPYRILGTMANSREFKESFGCAKKEPVCELW